MGNKEQVSLFEEPWKSQGKSLWFGLLGLVSLFGEPAFLGVVVCCT